MSWHLLKIPRCFVQLHKPDKQCCLALPPTLKRQETCLHVNSPVHKAWQVQLMRFTNEHEGSQATERVPPMSLIARLPPKTPLIRLHTGKQREPQSESFSAQKGQVSYVCLHAGKSVKPQSESWLVAVAEQGVYRRLLGSTVCRSLHSSVHVFADSFQDSSLFSCGIT